jgi:hypothetical protein
VTSRHGQCSQILGPRAGSSPATPAARTRASPLTRAFACTRPWLKTYPDSVPFWIDNDTGRQICVLIEDIWRIEPALLDRTQAMRNEIDQLLATMVRIGVADAARLEKALAL